MTRPLHSHSSERGAVAIEFALSVIVLAILVFGCIGVAMAFYSYEVVNQYARDASRYAIVHGADCFKADRTTSCSIGAGGDQNAPASMALMTYLNHQIYPGINGNNLVITTAYVPGPGATICNAPTTGCNGAGDQVTVSVTYQYLYNIPFIPARFINMNGASTMVISQ